MLNWTEVKPGDTLTIKRLARKRPYKLRVTVIDQLRMGSHLAIVQGERLRMDGKHSGVRSGACKALPKGQRCEVLFADDVQAIEPAPTTSGDWTIAYRTPRAHSFNRVTNWAGTWAQAVEMARIFAINNPDMQVYYVTSATYDTAYAIRITERVRSGEMSPELAASHRADFGNILTDDGKRVPMRETGTLTTDIIGKAPEVWAAELALRNGAI
jgi:hypothetical protein